MTEIASFIFVLSSAALFYAYAGFPGLVIVAGWLRNRRVEIQEITPKLTIIIAAHNEEQGIAKRIENTLLLDYPPEQLEVIIASDGSTDATDAIAAKYTGSNVLLLSLPRKGKIHALSAAAAKAAGEILIFSDANTLFEPQAMRMLARNFADPQVGGVCGNQIYVEHKNSDMSSKGENLYWSYDKWLKTMESRTGSIVSADGAIYAIRNELFRMPAETAVTDDFAISTAVIEQGYRLVFESKALAYEETSTAAKNEFGRKVRIINRGLRGVLMRRKLLNPLRYGFYSVILFSHKLLRRLVPVFLITLLASNVFLVPKGVFFLNGLFLQGFFYALAGCGYLLRKRSWGKTKVFYVPFFYCLANAAALLAILKVMSGKRIELWQPQRQYVES